MHAQLGQLTKFDPFPQLYCENYLSIAACEDISAHWPNAETMSEEEELNRSFAQMVRDDEISFSQFGEHKVYWRALVKSTLPPMLHEIADVFAPFISAKFGDDIARMFRAGCMPARRARIFFPALDS
jgi:hypothetical protein